MYAPKSTPTEHPHKVQTYDPTNIKKYNDAMTKLLLQNDNYDEDEEYDSMEYFLKLRQFIPLSFEDGVTRGSNIGDYDEFAHLDEIGKIKLGKNSYKYPKPTNYLFPNNER
jgi:hypothetical protein